MKVSSVLGRAFKLVGSRLPVFRSCRQGEISNKRTVPKVPRTTAAGVRGDWYEPVLLSPAMVGRRALRPETAGQVLMVLDLLEPDEFADYLARYYRAGLERFGVEWSYADLPTVLAAATHMLRPASYLEIGVRRGRSMGIVSHIVPEAHLLGFDLWIPDYAGMDNPGLAFVQDELRKLGHTGCIELIEGDSHQTVPDYFKNNPDAFFDLITVDGDHTREGAKADLQAVLPRLKVGGVLVFDDLVHPKHSYLRDVWREVIAGDRRFASWEFTDLGYGVAIAVRRMD